MRRYSFRTLAASALATSVLAAGAALLAVAPAAAQQSPAVSSDPVLAGDSRATAYAGNRQMGDCEGAGLAGLMIQVQSTIVNNTYITITSIPDGYTLTGVVVKGGSAYNVYKGDYRDRLHAPLNSSGGPAGMSHWFACGIQGDAAPTSSSDDSPTSTSGNAQGGKAPGGSDDVSGAGSDELANTGASVTLSLLVGMTLLLLGAGLVVAVRWRALGPVAVARWRALVRR